MSSLNKLFRLLSFVAACLLAPALLAQAQRPLDRVVAIVNEDVVLKSEFDARWADFYPKYQKQAGSGQAQSLPVDTLKKQLLDQLVLENLQAQLAKRAGVRIDDNELNQYFGQLAQENKMTFEQFTKALQQQGQYETTRELIRRELTLQRFRFYAVNRRINISPQEVENYLRSETGAQAIAPEYHIAHILIPGSATDTRHAELADQLYQQIMKGVDIRQLTSSKEVLGIPISGGDLGWRKSEDLPSAFTDVVPKLEAGQTSKPFTSPSGHHIVKLLETRGGSTLKLDQSKVRHILIKPNEIRTEKQAETLIRQLYQRIKNGEDFADVARQNTDDTQTMVAGGSLDWINDGMVPDDFMAVVHKTPVGTLTEPFRVSTGWHIIEVLDRRVQDVTEQNKRKQAEMLLRERKFDNELQNWLTEIHDTNYIDVKPDALQ